MVDVVDANIRREPTQYSRQIIVRAAMQRRFFKTPTDLMCPECHFELVLYVEEPHPGRSGQQNDRQLYKKEGPNAYGKDQPGRDRSDCNISYHGAEPRLPTAGEQADRQ